MTKRLVIAALLMCGAARAATINAASGSRTDVATAVASASAGDTINVPADNEEWSSAITISIPLLIIGAGIDQSIITNSSGGENTWLFLVDTESDSDIRISGFTMNGKVSGANAQGSGVFVDRLQKNVRIDHCKFSNMRRHGVQFVGNESWGVVDNCAFYNCYTAIEGNGNDGESWTAFEAAPDYGSVNSVVIEDCTFENNEDSLVTDLNNTIYASNGAKIYMRHCSGQEVGATAQMIFWDSHGNNSQEPFDGSSLRGTIWAIIDNVTLNCPNSYRDFYLRGGMHTLRNVSATTDGDFIVLTEEEAWASFSYTLDTAYPASDQIRNTWLVNCRQNATLITEADIISWHGDGNAPAPGDEDADEDFIQLDREFFIEDADNPPAFDPEGNPTAAGEGNGVDFLTYPHPRVTADDGVLGGALNATTINAGTVKQ